MRPGKYDRRHQLLITGAELRELKELDLAESFGLDRRIERYEGKRPFGIVSLGCGVLGGEFVDGLGWPLLRRAAAEAQADGAALA